MRSLTLRRLGVLLLAGGVPVMVYSVLDNPSYDSFKPVWMLDLEQRAFGSGRGTRVLDEVERRMAAVPFDPAEQKALQSVAIRAATIHADSRWHTIVQNAILRGEISPQRAAEYSGEFLRSFAAATEPEASALREAACAYAIVVPISEDDIEPLVTRVEADLASVSGLGTTMIRMWQNESPFRAALSSWVRAHTDQISSQMWERLVGDLSDVHVKTRRIVGRDSIVPFRLHGRPRCLIDLDDLWIEFNVGEVRLNGEAIRGSLGRSTVSGRSGVSMGSSIPSGSPMPVGESDIELDVGVSLGLIPDPASAVWSTRTTVRGTFSVVQNPAPIGVTFADDRIGHDEVQAAIYVLPPMYFDGRSGASPGRWRFQIRVRACPADLSHVAWAEQDGIRWRLGEIVSEQDVWTGTQLHGPRDRLIRRDGVLHDETVHPDLTQPIDIYLEPDPELSVRSLEVLRPWAHRIDIGTFRVTRWENPGHSSWNSGDFIPASPISGG